MTALAPYAALRDCTTNTVVASTTTIISWGFESICDQAPKGHISVPLGDAGEGTAGSGGTSFATTALTAAGGPGLPSMPAPLILELSLSGSAGPVDFRWVGFTVERKVASGELVLDLAGEDAYGALYSTMPAGGGKTTMADISLADALSGAQGSIAPIDAAERNRLLSADGTIPYLSGLLWSDAGATPPLLPGPDTWDTAARQRVTYSAVCASAVSGVPIWLDSLSDTVSRAVQTVAQRVGGAVIPGDAAAGVPQGCRGHLIVDSSDVTLNLSAVVV